MELLPVAIFLVVSIASVQSTTTGYASCHNRNMQFYIDGVKTPDTTNRHSFNQGDAIVLPNQYCVVGITCDGSGNSNTGVKAYLSSSLKTDNTWRCTTNPTGDWTRPGYDDSSWQTPNANFASWGVSSIPSSAKWIRPLSVSNNYDTIACRKDVCGGTYDCASEKPCWTGVPPQYFPHSISNMYVQCGVNTCEVMTCAGNLVWNPLTNTCG